MHEIFYEYVGFQYWKESRLLKYVRCTSIWENLFTLKTSMRLPNTFWRKHDYDYWIYDYTAGIDKTALHGSEIEEKKNNKLKKENPNKIILLNYPKNPKSIKTIKRLYAWIQWKIEGVSHKNKSFTRDSRHLDINLQFANGDVRISKLCSLQKLIQGQYNFQFENTQTYSSWCS